MVHCRFSKPPTPLTASPTDAEPLLARSRERPDQYLDFCLLLCKVLSLLFQLETFRCPLCLTFIKYPFPVNSLGDLDSPCLDVTCHLLFIIPRPIYNV